jgi:hypothetical protein
MTYANVLATPVAHAIHSLTMVLGPLVTLGGAISRGIRGWKEIEATSVDEIRLLTAISRQEGVVGARTAGIIVRATAHGDRRR